MNNIRTILLIGKTGSGKSALANVIAGGTNEFKESAGSVSKTKKVQIEEFEEGGVKYRVVDTVGFGDTSMTLEKVLRKLALMGYSVKDGLSQILFVIDKEGLVGEAKSTYDLLSKVVFDENIAKYTTVVRTAFAHFRDRGKCQEDKRKIIEESGGLGELVGGCNGIIYVDNPPLDIKDDPEVLNSSIKRREDSRKILLEHLKSACQSNPYNPENLNKLSSAIDKYMKDKEEVKKNMDKLNKGKIETEGWKDDLKEGILSGKKWVKMLGLAKKNSLLNKKITKEMVKHIGNIEPELKKEMEEELKNLGDGKEKIAEWRWFKSPKVKILEELEDKLNEIEKIWRGVEKVYVEFLNKEITEKKEELVYKVDTEDRKEGGKISSDLKYGIEILLMIREKEIKEKNGSGSYQSLSNYALDKLGEKVEVERLKEICGLKSCLMTINTRDVEIADKIKKIGSVLNSNSSLEKIEEQKREIDELEEECWKIEEEYLQIKIDKAKNNNDLKELWSLQQEELKTKRIIRKVTSFLETKEDYLEIRLKIAKKLQECCEESDRNNIGHQKRKLMIKLIYDVLGIIDIPIKAVNNLSKLVDAIGDINDYSEMTSRIESYKVFKSELENGSDNWSLFKKSYDSLREILDKNRGLEVSYKIINDLELEDKMGSTRPLKTFEVRHEKICSIAENWKKEYSGLKEMKDKVCSVVKILSDLGSELNREKNRIKGVKSKVLETKIEVPPK